MTQQQAQRADFGPSWPEVTGFGAASPNKQFYGFDRKGKFIKCATVATVALLADFYRGFRITDIIWTFL